MRIAYLTTDEVNEHLAQHLSQQCRFTLYPLQPRDPPPDGRFDAVLYDLDDLPPLERESVLSGLLAGPLPCPTAVHSYNLEEDRIEALRMRGVAVHRWLDGELFQVLCRAAQSDGAAFLPDPKRNANHASELFPRPAGHREQTRLVSDGDDSRDALESEGR